MYKLVTNKIRCKFCGDYLESMTAHDFVFCRCGKCANDGGLEYTRRAFATDRPEDCYEDCSVYVDTNTGKLLTARDIHDEPLKAESTPVPTPDIPEEVTEERSDEPEKLPEEDIVTETDEDGKPVAGRYPWGKD